MDPAKKKQVMIGVAVVCIGIAATLFARQLKPAELPADPKAWEAQAPSCPACSGSGKTAAGACQPCQGAGKLLPPAPVTNPTKPGDPPIGGSQPPGSPPPTGTAPGTPPRPR